MPQLPTPQQPAPLNASSNATAVPDQKLGRVAAPTRVLQALLSQQHTGRLQIRDLGQTQPSWFIYLAQGQVQFATGDDPTGDRLAYLLQRSCRHLLPTQAKQRRKAAQSPYAYLHQCWQSERISLQELRSLLRSASQEALMHILSAPQAKVGFEPGLTIAPPLISLDFAELIAPLEDPIEQWQLLNQQKIHPHSRLTILRSSRFTEQFSGPIQAISRRKGPLDLQALLAGQPSLYAIAARLNADLLPVAQVMQQAVKLGYLRWLTARSAKRRSVLGAIACIDNNPIVQQQVRQALEPLGYRVVCLGHSPQALSILVKERPCLILLDAALAADEARGLCHLLRSSSLLQSIPLLLLTPHDSLINPIRTKTAGAQGWLVKPLETPSLVKAVQRWAKPQSAAQAA